eukprot:TRINITY_DN24101_c0_g1_i1.p1 TRINITY_DN24101_c0_g1~~TRINITY_DN24101_c0_g1_i1.p1  ORF type:complete len:566 (-),score=126.06 TRINITY_DN24101_c0_g1_i1:273-1928(-)
MEPLSEKSLEALSLGTISSPRSLPSLGNLKLDDHAPPAKPLRPPSAPPQRRPASASAVAVPYSRAAAAGRPAGEPAVATQWRPHSASAVATQMASGGSAVHACRILQRLKTEMLPPSEEAARPQRPASAHRPSRMARPRPCSARCRCESCRPGEARKEKEKPMLQYCVTPPASLHSLASSVYSKGVAKDSLVDLAEDTDYPDSDGESQEPEKTHMADLIPKLAVLLRELFGVAVAGLSPCTTESRGSGHARWKRLQEQVELAYRCTGLQKEGGALSTKPPLLYVQSLFKSVASDSLIRGLISKEQLERELVALERFCNIKGFEEISTRAMREAVLTASFADVAIREVRGLIAQAAEACLIVSTQGNYLEYGQGKDVALREAVVCANPAWLELFEYQESEIIGMAFKDIDGLQGPLTTQVAKDRMRGLLTSLQREDEVQMVNYTGRTGRPLQITMGIHIIKRCGWNMAFLVFVKEHVEVEGERLERRRVVTKSKTSRSKSNLSKWADLDDESNQSPVSVAESLLESEGSTTSRRSKRRGLPRGMSSALGSNN